MENTNNMQEERNPIAKEQVNFTYSKGIYSFFCKSTTKLFLIVFAILSTIKDFTETLTKEQYRKLISCLWIVNHTANKLEGICSISSSVFDNLFCKCRMKLKDCICKYCYAHNQQSYQTGLKEHNIINGLILRNILIPVKFFKFLIIVFPYLRIESFGDVANVTQARNYIRIIKAFPEKRCAIWSKNIVVWEKAFQFEGKPNNTTYVHSSRELNKVDNIDRNRFSFVDHIFTVYTKSYATKNNIVINCGGRKCLECIMKRKNCYYRLSKNNDTYFINELKK